MLGKEDLVTIRAPSEPCIYQKDIAMQVGVPPRTVSRALKRGRAPKPAGVL